MGALEVSGRLGYRSGMSLRAGRLVKPLMMLAVVLALGACSGSVEFSFGGETASEAAVDLIEGDAMAQRLKIAAITNAVCEDPAVEEVGTVFGCTAESDGTTVLFEVEIEEGDRIFAAPTNVVDESFIAEYEASAVEALNRAEGFTLAAADLDCGDVSVVLDENSQMFCLLSPSDVVESYDAVLTVTDTISGAFSVDVIGVAD